MLQRDRLAFLRIFAEFKKSNRSFLMTGLTCFVYVNETRHHF